MAVQPDHILYPTFTNINEYDGGNNTMRYFYRSGNIHVENGVNIDEFKRINLELDNTGRNRTTRIKTTSEDSTSYTTPGGTEITFDSNDELWLNHNYAGNPNVNRSPGTVEDSWWYDVDNHREYRVYLVIGYNNTKAINGIEYRDWRVKRAIIEYNDATQDTTQGTFQFTTKPPGTVSISGSVTITSDDNQPAYRDFTLKIYQDSSLLKEEDIAMSFAGGSPVTISTNIQVGAGNIDVGDRISLSLEADSKNSSATSAVVVTNYELEVNGEGGTYKARQPVLLGIEGDIELSDDCNALLNNVSEGRGNDKLQVIEFELNNLGNGINHPSNVPEILANEAVKAQVPESFFTQAGPTRGKYRGSKSTRLKINDYTYPDYGYKKDTLELGVNILSGSLDDFEVEPKSTIVDIRDTNIGYFNQIIDPYPVLNGKTAYFVKYLINSNNTVQDPSVSEVGKINFLNTFRFRNVNSEIATYLPSIPNDTNNQELLELRENSSLYEIGKYPYPILWSQISATDYSRNLPITGSVDFYSATGVNVDDYVQLAFTTDNPIVTADLPRQTNFTEPVRTIPPTNLKPTSITYPDSANNREIYNTDKIVIPNEDKTDTWNLGGIFTFYTTPVPILSNYPFLPLNRKRQKDFGDFKFRILRTRNGVESKLPISEINNISLNVDYEAEVNTSPITFKSANIPFNNNIQGAERVFYSQDNDLNIKFHSDIQSSYLGFGEREGGDNGRRASSGNRIKYTLSFTVPNNSIQPGDEFDFQFEGETDRPDAFGGDDDNTRDDYRRSIFPALPTDNPSKAELNLSFLGANTSNTEDVNNATVPYWQYISGQPKQIELVSQHLKDRYGSQNGGFFQGDLPYSPSYNPVFPASQEPSFVGFPGATDPFEILPGDEFRFMNSEEEVYKVINVSTSGRIIVTFDRAITENINLDFFLIRRYKESSNVVILNQQKPYAFPASASSSPGLLLPEYLESNLETNPDAVISNLIERNLIE